VYRSLFLYLLFVWQFKKPVADGHQAFIIRNFLRFQTIY
jgi:hypothetical protein